MVARPEGGEPSAALAADLATGAEAAATADRCATADPADPAATCALGDFESWIVFVDLNSN